ERDHSWRNLLRLPGLRTGPPGEVAEGCIEHAANRPGNSWLHAIEYQRSTKLPNRYEYCMSIAASRRGAQPPKRGASRPGESSSTANRPPASGSASRWAGVSPAHALVMN